MKYAYSTGSDTFEGEFDSPEEAALEGFGYDPDVEVVAVGHIISREMADYAPSADWVIDWIAGQAFDDVGEAADDYPAFGPSGAEAEKWLDNELKTLLRRFESKFKLAPTFWAVGGITDYEIAEKDAKGEVTEVRPVRKEAAKPADHPAHQMADGTPDPLDPANWPYDEV